MTDPVPKPKRSKAKKAGIIIIAVGIAVAAIVIASFALFVYNVTNPPSSIVVSGQVTTKGYGTIPVTITFVDKKTGVMNSGGVNNNRYEVSLPNGPHEYKVVIEWTGLAGSKGTCEAGSIGYDTQFDTFKNYDFEC
jgi:hypothetical protein